MYKLKPVFNVPLEIKSTCTMYKLKNLHESAVKMFNKSDKDIIEEIHQLTDREIELVLKKQNEVLKTLEELEIRVNNLEPQFPKSEKVEPPSVVKKQSTQPSKKIISKKHEKIPTAEINKKIAELTKTDTVICADPEDPPYSLLALPLLWSSVSWDITYHIHSSLTVDSKVVSDKLNVFKNWHSSVPNVKTVKVIVIWKHTEPSTVIVRSPANSLIGEVSLIRLFDRYLTAESLSITDQVNVDQVLDSIYTIKYSSIDRLSELCNLIDPSDKELNVAQVALWSLLYSKQNVKKCPKSLEKWFEQLSKKICL
ncbi:uncharacterized protein LOC126843507 isoform X2 [Adelges cooleyi]|uniref:uncharacterized protein LOC126843507 isoform X2 n=1 Tax=Adelges cooleyi TaxID=133065 RepID=UPI00218071EC|nr:uncharacterized protein LOC126843507 isoform X2 [Adelges cooleyi]